MHDVDVIEGIISEIPFIIQTNDFECDNNVITGCVQVKFDDLTKPIHIVVSIFPQYPLKNHESESIKFTCSELINYKHVMEDGSICIHTSHHTVLKQKLLIDFYSLKLWFDKYYFNNARDEHYEHVITSESLINEKYNSYVFTDVDYKFAKGNFGSVKLSRLQTGTYKDKPIDNFIVQGFSLNNISLNCNWGKFYSQLHNSNEGLFFFLGDHPAKFDRFIYKEWSDFNDLLPTEFLKLINASEFNDAGLLPIFLGYDTVDNEIHWQVALIEKGKLPLEEKYVQKGIVALPEWELINDKVNWALSRNSSYKYFYGRGALCPQITESKILILGVGAIGSIIAKSLTRGGAREISIADYDVKEYENICRSEYMFQFGLGDKANELEQILSLTSPFADIEVINGEYFESIIKMFRDDPEARENFISTLNKYEIVFDCTTDNDLMFILNNLELECDVINLSITNHANELVCAFHPNIYRFVLTQFEDVLDNLTEDLYEPTGCWNPTFKASYTDIDMLVQIATKHINNIYKMGSKKKNFIIKVDKNEACSIELREF